jgi:hypothetical protein
MKSAELSLTCLDDIAAGTRLPTFNEVRALARELLSLRDTRELLQCALDAIEVELEELEAEAELLRFREESWRRALSPETWLMLQQLARRPAPAERAEAGEA